MSIIGRDALVPTANLIAFAEIGTPGLTYAVDVTEDMERAILSDNPERTEKLKNVRTLQRIDFGGDDDLVKFTYNSTRDVKLGLICFSTRIDLPTHDSGDRTVRIPISAQEEAVEALRKFKQQKARRLFYAERD
eukprot:SAG11_NODE_547_length_8604_cov_4.710641_3_plen_134_part_00